jgi:hypothetical protein
MAGNARVTDVRGSVDPNFDRWQWRIERIAWVAMGVVIVLALLGALGGGGPMTTVSRSNGSTELEYSRLVRFQGTSDLRIEAEADGTDEVRIALDRDYVANVEFEDISPEPERVETDGNNVVYIFAAGSEARDVEVTFRTRPERVGVLSGEIHAGGGERIKFWQFAFP